MKKILLLPLLLSLRCYAADMSFSKFGGLDTESSPASLTDKTPDSENVVTDLNGGLRPRDGFSLCHASSATAQWVFKHSNGTVYQIAQVGGSLLADTGGCTFSVTVSTIPSNLTIAGAALGDKFFFMDTTNGLRYWDTSTVTVASATLTGTQLVAHKNRLWAAGLTGDPRAVRASAFNDGTSWNLVTDPAVTDPAVFVIGGAVGDTLTTLYSSHLGSLVWMGSRSFGVISGDDRSSFAVRTYSDNVGTSYPTSVQDCDGLLRWLGPARTIYEWDGATLKNIGLSIQSYLGEIGQGDSNRRGITITDKSDYDAGTNYRTTTSRASGSILIDTNNGNPSENGFESGGASWTLRTGSSIVTTGCGTPPDGTHYLRMTRGPSGYIEFGDFGDLTGTGISAASVGTCPTMTQVSFNTGLLGDADETGYYWVTDLDSGQGAYQTAGNRFYGTGGTATAYVGTDGTYWYVDLLEGGVASYTSATFVSDPLSLGNVSSFGQFVVDESTAGGTISYAIYTDSDAVKTVTSGVPSGWVSSQTVTSGSYPTLSTGAYAFMTATLSRTSYSQDPMNNSMALSWTEGNPTPTPSAWFRQRYWLGVSRNSATNNKVLVYDRNKQWQRYSGINASSLAIYNGNLFFGNSSGIYQYESGSTDAGTPIVCYYRTPTFSPNSPNVGAFFKDIRMTTENSAETLTTSYQIDGDTSVDYSLGNFTMNARRGIQNFQLPFPITQVNHGKNVSFRLGVSSSTDFRILGFTLNFMPDVIPLD